MEILLHLYVKNNQKIKIYIGPPAICAANSTLRAGKASDVLHLYVQANSHYKRSREENTWTP
jgi:hypothetical protein